MRLLPVRDTRKPNVLAADRLRRGLSSPIPLFLLDAVVWQRSEVLLLGHWQSTAQLGFYSLSAIISADLMEFSPVALSTCMLPLVSRAIHTGVIPVPPMPLVKTSLSITLLALPVCILTIVFFPAAVVLCFGTAYLPMVLPLRLLTVSATIGSIATVSLTHLPTTQAVERKCAWALLPPHSMSCWRCHVLCCGGLLAQRLPAWLRNLSLPLVRY